MKESDLKQIENIPGWNALFTEVLNAISDAQDNGQPRVIVTFDLDHETKNIEMTIYDAKISGGDLIQ